MACGICYAYRLDTQIPDQQCEDARCTQPFHQTCLYEVSIWRPLTFAHNSKFKEKLNFLPLLGLMLVCTPPPIPFQRLPDSKIDRLTSEPCILLYFFPSPKPGFNLMMSPPPLPPPAGTEPCGRALAGT